MGVMWQQTWTRNDINQHKDRDKLGNTYRRIGHYIQPSRKLPKTVTEITKGVVDPAGTGDIPITSIRSCHIADSEILVWMSSARRGWGKLYYSGRGGRPMGTKYLVVRRVLALRHLRQSDSQTVTCRDSAVSLRDSLHAK